MIEKVYEMCPYTLVAQMWVKNETEKSPAFSVDTATLCGNECCVVYCQ